MHALQVCVMEKDKTLVVGCVQVQHCSTRRRSLCPCIVSTRETYLFTSHAESPLCAWDLR